MQTQLYFHMFPLHILLDWQPRLVPNALTSAYSFSSSSHFPAGNVLTGILYFKCASSWTQCWIKSWLISVSNSQSFKKERERKRETAQLGREVKESYLWSNISHRFLDAVLNVAFFASEKITIRSLMRMLLGLHQYRLYWDTVTLDICIQPRQIQLCVLKRAWKPLSPDVFLTPLAISLSLSLSLIEGNEAEAPSWENKRLVKHRCPKKRDSSSSVLPAC